ncbi:MAG: TonB-dependent receptor [Muribaculaceae bacterium]|nr:TonB-dependent receptor [Muribaculaceae bacterium]
MREKETIRRPLAAVALAAVAATTAFGSDSALAPDTVNMLNEIVVTGTGTSVQQRLLPYAVSTVGERTLEATGQTQLLAAISGMVPGLFVSERSVLGFGVSNGGSGHIKIRGIGGDRASAVLVMVDGQPQFAGIYSHHIADFYGKENVERVEVLRGPASVLYGSNAMAGTINVITRNASGGVHTDLTVQYGSFNTLLTTISNTARVGHFSSVASLSYNRTDGNIDKLTFRQADGYAKVGYEFSPHWKAYADYTLMNFRGRDGIYPTLSDPTSTDVYRQNVTRGEVSLSATNTYGRTQGTARMYYTYGNHYIDDPRHFHSTDSRYGITLFQSTRTWRGADIGIGFDFDSYGGLIPMSGGTDTGMGILPHRTIVEYSPYLVASQSVAGGVLCLDGGLRLAMSNRFDSRLVPQFGVAVNPWAGWTFKGNLAMGFRNPSFRELYLYRMANPDLEQERMMNYEVTVGRSFGRLFSVELTAYYSKGDNMIQVVDFKNQNTGRFINKGIEVSARSMPLRNLWVSATYSYLHTNLHNLTGAPRHQYYIGAEWRPVEPLSIAMDLKGTSRLFVADDMDYQSYALLNTKISWQVWRHLCLMLRLENITDARYTINRGYPMPGFTVLGGVRISI